MSKSILKTVGLCLLAAFAASCIPATKYKDLKTKSTNYLNERDALKRENLTLSMNNEEMKAMMEGIEKEIRQAERDLEQKKQEIRELQRNYNSMEQNYADLQNAQEELIRGNVKETTRLLRELQQAQTDLQSKENELRELERSLNAKKAGLDELTYELEKRNERLVELEQILANQKAAVSQLKDRVSQALYGFENDGLTVTQRNGKVYVSLDEQLLFKTGSWSIDSKGAQAIKKLAGVLEQNRDINVMIEGHTDDVPYNGSGQLKDNWDLSVKRATTVVRLLLESGNIDPSRLTASGRSEYVPVDPAKSDAARQKNRRTEIILTPKLDELFKVLGSN